MNSLTRRNFAKTVAFAAASSALSRTRVLGANEKIRLGFIGVGNRGDQVLDGFLKHPDADVAAVCDLHRPYLDFSAKKIGTKNGASPKQFQDYRKLLEMKDLDAVVINTPDHWHALQTIEACQAGRDVYVEKPTSLCVAEGRAMVNAVRRHGRICQVGLQRRSAPGLQEACALVRSGAIGKITVARTFHIQNEWPTGIGKPSDETPPEGMDWDQWLGPAPKKAYNKNRALYRFRWFYDYSGGQLTNTGVHYLDLVHAALGQEAPLSVAAMGGKFAIEDNREIPDTLEVMWTYPGGTLVTFSQFNANSAPAALPGTEMEFRGTKGTLYIRGGGYEIVPEDVPTLEFPVLNPLDRAAAKPYRAERKQLIEPKKGSGSTDVSLHARNFLDCVKSRAKCVCDIETGHRSTTTTLIANIAHKTESCLKWDARTERFENNDAANKLLGYDYRAPWKTPAS